MELTFAENLFICWVVFFGLWAIYGIILLVGIVLGKLKGKRPYDGRFRSGGYL